MAPQPVHKRVAREVYRRLRTVEALTTPLALLDQALRAQAFLRGSGWLESYRKRRPVAFGKPLPFYTYSAIAFLEPRIDRSMNIFEYGSGFSTLWWADRVSKVVACEHDAGWYERMKTLAPDNVTLLHQDLVPGGAYSQSATAYRSDVIVIDGRDRVNCARACLSGLTDRGVIVWDNSDRDRYREGYEHLRDHGFRRLDFTGPGPVLFMPWTTSVFYRPDNCLSI